VDSRLNVTQNNTKPSVNVLKDGLEILTRSALSVGSCFIIASVTLQNYSLSVLDECRQDEDCPFTKACISKKCQDPCTQISCGSRAICKVDFHKARCLCPLGLQGNPLVSCDEVGCLHDEDCQSNQKCNHDRRTCETLCSPSPCAAGAQCLAENHRENCRCSPPLQGDGFSVCEKRKSLFNLFLSSCFLQLFFILGQCQLLLQQSLNVELIKTVLIPCLVWMKSVSTYVKQEVLVLEVCNALLKTQ
jgi:hypothetical protein